MHGFRLIMNSLAMQLYHSSSLLLTPTFGAVPLHQLVKRDWSNVIYLKYVLFNQLEPKRTIRLSSFRRQPEVNIILSFTLSLSFSQWVLLKFRGMVTHNWWSHITFDWHRLGLYPIHSRNALFQQCIILSTVLSTGLLHGYGTDMNNQNLYPVA